MIKNKFLILIVIICLILSVFPACKNNEDGEIKVTDQIGNEVVLKKTPSRIVSGYYISSSACIA
ncbi:MAG: ABC transporter substrate-binding protein, partial [Firmicutes bacterium]|nr:ABC transporter substrate-binding protein [Candidatus Caballimonas caccae]